MKTWSPEEISKFQLAGMEAFAGLTNKALEGFSRWVELNLQTARSTLLEAQERTRKTLAIQEPRQFLELQMTLFQPATDGALAYRRQVLEIMAGVRSEFDKVLQAQYAANKQGLQDFLDGIVSNAPAGSTPPLAACQGVVNATSAFYESMQSTLKEAIQVAEAGFQSTTEAVANGVRHRAAQPARAASK